MEAPRLDCFPIAEPQRGWHSGVMAYSLSFGPDFFWQDRRDIALPDVPRKQPTSIEEAISQLSDETWTRLALEVFHCDAKFLDLETVVQKILEADTCLNLDSPIEVAIDRDGDFTVVVYDRDAS